MRILNQGKKEIPANMASAPLVSIIVLTYNNLDITRQCLESILAKTTVDENFQQNSSINLPAGDHRPPAYELILVDNASSDETPQYLKEFAAAHANVKLILNDINQGFARGNNQGAALAEGEYLVFLNNDTVVTNGWLSGLLRALQLPGVGMAGPVTNMVGNEARILVDYTDLVEMDEFAARYTSQHQNVIFDVRMLAWFCVAIRRDVFGKVGPLDERFELGMFEDDDYALRLSASGYRLVCTEEVFVHHWGSAGFSVVNYAQYWNTFSANLRKFEEKWHVRWQPPTYRPELVGTQLRNLVDDKLSLAAQLLERDQRIIDVQRENSRLRTLLDDTFTSQGWKLISRLRRLRAQIAPIGSTRDRLTRAVGKLILRTYYQIDHWLTVAGLVRHVEQAPEKILDKILARHSEAKGIIVFVPSIPWDVPLFQRPHQLALAFERQGWLVFFCEYIHGAIPEFITEKQNLYRITNIDLDVLKVLPSPIVFTLVYNTDYLINFTSPCVVYEYIDELKVFPGNLHEMERIHDHMTQSAQIVVATADKLYQRVKNQREDVILAPNGVDFEFIRQKMDEVQKPPSDIKKLVQQKKPIIGYYGALARWFDYELLAYAAEVRPQYNFLLIGPDYDGSQQHSRIGQLPNVFWLGVKPYSILPGYLKYFDVATIPFTLDEITHSTSPLKLFEYMTGQKPIVTTAMNECKKYPVILIAENKEDYINKIDRALELREDAQYLDALLQTAQENTWDMRAAQILDRIQQSCLAKNSGV